MENRELKLKDIAGYLPYGLKRRCENEKSQTFGKIIDFNMINADFHIYKQHKPILRPLSDLYIPITHNGKDIIPILELAKIAFPHIPDWVLKGKKAIYNSQYGNIEFYFDDKSFKAYRHDEGFLPCINQYQLFDYLNELKFDYRQLCEKGLAIPVYDLDKNPYEVEI